MRQTDLPLQQRVLLTALANDSDSHATLGRELSSLNVEESLNVRGLIALELARTVSGGTGIVSVQITENGRRFLEASRD